MTIVIEKKMKGNILEQIRRKISECQEKKNIVIEFEKGEYLLSDKKAVEDFEKLMRGDLDYDTHWGKGDIGYNKGLSFEGIDGVTIKGNGSILIFEGLISPLTFIDCSQIKIQDLCIDWKRPPFSIGKITEVEKETVTIKGHSDFPIYGGEPIWALMDYNPYKQRFGQVWKFRNMSTIRKISENIYEFDTSVSEKLIEGYMIVLRHVGNYRPCMHFLKSQDIYIENVTLFNNPGMGIVGHYSKNFTFRRLSVKPKKDHIMSTTTDATHFISCEGVLDFEECYFEGMGDDAINVHGFYNYITKIISENQVEVTILNENGNKANKGISVQCSDGVKIGHNQIKGCDVAIDIKSCDHVELYENITYNQKIQFNRNG